MADAMRDHITECGEKIILQRSKEIDGIMENKKIDEFKVSPDFIDQLLTLHRKYATLIRKEFNNDSLFEKALVQAFQRIMKNEPQDHLTFDINQSNAAHKFLERCLVSILYFESVTPCQYFTNINKCC